MIKLNKGDLGNISLNNLKNLFNKQKQNGITGFKEYFKQEIYKKLEEQEDLAEKHGYKFEEPIKFSNQKYKEIEEELNTKEEYINIIKGYREEFSQNYVDKMIEISGGKIDNLKDLLNNAKPYTHFFMEADEIIILKILNNFNYKEDFEKLKEFIGNGYAISGPFYRLGFKSINLFFESYKINSFDDFYKIVYGKDETEYNYFVYGGLYSTDNYKNNVYVFKYLSAEFLQEIIPVFDYKNADVKKLIYQDTNDLSKGFNRRSFDIEFSKKYPIYNLATLGLNYNHKLIKISKSKYSITLAKLINSIDDIDFIHKNINSFNKKIELIEEAKKIENCILNNKSLFDEEKLLDLLKNNSFEDIKTISNFFIKTIEMNPNGIEFGYFKKLVTSNIKVSNILNVNYNNFTDFMDEKEVLLPLNKDDEEDFNLKTKAWTKAWFEEKPERKIIFKDFAEGMLEKIKIYNLYDYFIYNPQNYDIIKNTIEKIEKSKQAQSIISNFDGHNTYVYRRFLEYMIKNKSKKFVDFIQKLSFIKDFKIGIDINKFKSLKDYFENGKLQEKKIQEDYEKMLNKLQINNRDKKLKQLVSSIKSKGYEGIEKMILEIQYEYFEYLYHRKFRIKIKTDLNQFLSGEKIEDEKIDSPIFIEAYKIYMGTIYNKKILGELLAKFLKGEKGLYQYNTEKNKYWLENNLSEKEQEIWLSQNERIYNIGENKQEKTTNIKQEIKDKFEISINKIDEINKLGFKFKVDFDDVWKLVSFYNKNIKKQEKEIRNKDTKNLFDDLKLQIDRLKELKKETSGKKRKINKIKIYREINPLRSLMMGNWVQGSCLSFYSSIGNFYSSISNTIDTNKGVYYIEDENGILLARVLLGIDENKKLMRFKMYFAKNVNIDLNKYFNKYYLDFAKQMNFEINGSQGNLSKIESERWYPDGTVNLN